MLRQSISEMTVTQEEERLDQYRLKTTVRCAANECKQKIESVLDSWSTNISHRDRFSLAISFEGEAKSISDFDLATRNLVCEFLDSDDEDECELSLEMVISKNVSHGTLSIYNPVAFGNYLDQEPILHVLSALASRMIDSLIFEVFGVISVCATPSIVFRSAAPEAADDIKVQLSPEERQSTLDLFKDNSFNKTIPGNFIPKDFRLDKSTGVPAIDLFFAKACSLLAAVFISNSAELTSGGEFSYKICGYKNIAGVVLLNEILPVKESLYKIADWAYGVGGSSDKIGLVRNVLSLYIGRLEDVALHSEIFSAIHSNYQIYLKGNIESYLEVKSKVADVLVDTTTKTQALVESLVDSLKNGVCVLLTFILTVVVVNGLKDTNVSAIFSTVYIWVVALLSILMTVWVVFSCFSSLRQYDKGVDTIEQVLKLNYHMVLQSVEIDHAFSPIRTRNREYLKGQAWRYSIVWIIIAVILTTGFVCGHLVFRDSPQPSTASASASAVSPMLLPGVMIAPLLVRSYYGRIFESAFSHNYKPKATSALSSDRPSSSKK